MKRLFSVLFGILLISGAVFTLNYIREGNEDGEPSDADERTNAQEDLVIETQTEQQTEEQVYDIERAQNITEKDSSLSTAEEVSSLSYRLLGLDSFVEFGCVVHKEEQPQRVECLEKDANNESIFAGSNVIFPDNTRIIRFEYRFSGAHDGDYAALALDGEAIWVLSAKTGGVGEEFEETITWVGERSGSNFLGIHLYPVGSPNVTFEIRNIELISGTGR